MRELWPGILLALSAAPAAAQTSAPVEGIYQSATREVGSQLILAPDGRFLWVFAYGSLDLSGEGRWTRGADGTITLDSEPAVTPPRFELVSRSRDQAPGVEARLLCDTGEVRHLLNVLFDHAGNEPVPVQFRDFVARSREDAPGAVTGVRLFSESLNLMSEHFPVDPREANLLTFRFHPNDIGRADFRSQPVTIADGVLTLEWAGLPVRYRREASAVGAELPRLPPVPRVREDAAPFPLAVALFEPVAELRARAGAGLIAIPDVGTIVASGPVDLRLSYGDHSIDLGRIEGGTRPLMIGEEPAGDGPATFVSGLSFNYQDGPLMLEEALARAQALKAWLEQAGFVPPRDVTIVDPAPFNVMGEPEIATDWAGAARMLADEERRITEMHLYALRTSDLRAAVRLENAGRLERDACAHSTWPGGGRDWRLSVRIERSRE